MCMRKFLKYLFAIVLLLLVILTAVFWTGDIPLDTLKAKYTSPSSKFVEVMGMDVHYRDEGQLNDSLPLVLLHGTGASLHTWEATVLAMKDRYRIITLDLPAYGLTGPNPERVYTQEFYSKFMAAFLDRIGVQKCIIGGNSLGGAIAWRFTSEHPSRVEKLILIDAGGYPTQSTSVPIAFRLARTPVLKHSLKFITPRPLAAKSVKNVYADPGKVTEAVVDRYYELVLREGNRQALIDRMKGFDYPDNADMIKSITIPTLVIWGDKDGLIPVENAYRFHDDLPNDSLVVLKNLGHVPMEEDALQTTAVIRSFLEKR